MRKLFQKKNPEIKAQIVKKGLTRVRDYVRYVDGKPVHVSGYEVLRKPGKLEEESPALSSPSPHTPSPSPHTPSPASPRLPTGEGEASPTVPVPEEFTKQDYSIEGQLAKENLVGFRHAYNRAIIPFVGKIGNLTSGRPFPDTLPHHRTFKESLDYFASTFINQPFTDHFGNSVSMHPYVYFHLSGLGRHFPDTDRATLYSFASEYLTKDKKNYSSEVHSSFHNFEQRLEGIRGDRGSLQKLSALPDVLQDPDMVFAYPGRYVYLKLYNDTSGIMGRGNFPYKAVASLTTDKSGLSSKKIAQTIKQGKTTPRDLINTHLIWKRGSESLTKSWGKESLNVDYFFLLTPQQFKTHAQKIFCY